MVYTQCYKCLRWFANYDTTTTNRCPICGAYNISFEKGAENAKTDI